MVEKKVFCPVPLGSFNASAMLTTVPSFYRDDDGFISVQWPTPRAAAYFVSAELLHRWVDDFNELARYRKLFDEVG